MNIDTNERWLQFTELAQALLLQGQTVNKDKTTIQLAIQHSLYNSIFLQLEIGEEVKWYRTSWLKLDDAEKFHDPIKSLPYIGLKIQPAITYESGTIKKEAILQVVNYINNLSLKPQLEPQNGFTLDGIYYTLMIGVETSQTIYKWHTLPEEWKELEGLIAMLEDLNEKLK